MSSLSEKHPSFTDRWNDALPIPPPGFIAVKVVDIRLKADKPPARSQVLNPPAVPTGNVPRHDGP
jgi:hypothetical protein